MRINETVRGLRDLLLIALMVWAALSDEVAGAVALGSLLIVNAIWDMHQDQRRSHVERRKRTGGGL